MQRRGSRVAGAGSLTLSSGHSDAGTPMMTPRGTLKQKQNERKKLKKTTVLNIILVQFVFIFLPGRRASTGSVSGMSLDAANNSNRRRYSMTGLPLKTDGSVAVSTEGSQNGKRRGSVGSERRYSIGSPMGSPQVSPRNSARRSSVR